MCPAPGKCDIRIFPVQLPVSGIAVTDNYTCKALQEFSRVVCFSGPLIFIQDDGKPVKQQGKIDGQLRINKSGDGNHPQDDTDADHIQGPGAAVEGQKV